MLLCHFQVRSKKKSVQLLFLVFLSSNNYSNIFAPSLYGPGVNPSRPPPASPKPHSICCSPISPPHPAPTHIPGSPMASFLPVSDHIAAALIIFSLFLISAKAQDGFDFGPEKRTHLHFFFHDVVSGRNPTAIRVAGAGGASLFSGFGDIMMIDDALTEEADPSSKLIGRAQGFYAMAAQQEMALLMTMNYHFVTGDYNGSTLAVLARNSVFSETREMSVVGGTGYFRLARGYAVARTQALSMGGDAVVEYNVYVTHY